MQQVTLGPTTEQVSAIGFGGMPLSIQGRPPEEAGRQEVTISARTRGDSITGVPATLEVAESQEEFFGAEMRGALLRRIAEETGGRVYTPRTVKDLAQDLALGGRGVTVVREMDLWDMPAIFLLLIALLGAEWGYRRVRRLA